jgi:hypothetical protein
VSRLKLHHRNTTAGTEASIAISRQTIATVDFDRLEPVERWAKIKDGWTVVD